MILYEFLNDTERMNILLDFINEKNKYSFLIKF